MIKGVGPMPSRVMIVGDYPRQQEAAFGEAFSMHSMEGVELNRYLRRQLYKKRDNFYLTHIVKECPADEVKGPSQRDVEKHEPEFWSELVGCAPKTVVTMGRIPTAWFKDCSPDDLDMERIHGIPFHAAKYDVTVFPMYRIYDGMAQADRFGKYLVDDFTNLGKFLNGALILPHDIYPTPEYSEVRTPLYIDAPIVGMDTEGWVHRPWGLSWTGDVGRGYVVPAGVRVQVDDRTKVIFHYALHDLPVLRALGVTIKPENIEDTNILAYLLGDVPKGLKNLSYRVAGMEMTEYEELTKDADLRIAQQYLRRVMSNVCGACQGRGDYPVPYKRNAKCGDASPECPKCFGTGIKHKVERCGTCNGDGTSWPTPTTQIVIEDDGTEREYKPQSIGRRARRLLESNHLSKSSWDGIDESVRGPVEAQLGKLPVTTLDDIDGRQRVIDYAARDADATLRVYRALRPRLAQYGLERAYEIDKGIIPIIDKMQQNGILLDKGYFKTLECELLIAKQEQIDKLATFVGKRFNPGSPDQVKDVLYGQFGLIPSKKTKKGDSDSTDAKTLEALKIKYVGNEEASRIIDGILDYREINKMLGTYVCNLPRMVGSDGRLRTNFSLTRTSTGRLASSNPNLQNCFTGDTEVLTRTGWVRFDKLQSLNGEVAQYNPLDKSITFVQPIAYITKTHTPVIRISNQHIDLAVTPDHRCLLRDRKTGKHSVVLANNYLKDAQQINAGYYVGGDAGWSDDELRLLLAIQADGSWTRSFGVDFGFSKSRKIIRLTEILDNLNIEYTKYSGTRNRTRFYIKNCTVVQKIYAWLGVDKLFDWRMFLALSSKQLEVVRNEVMLWDGCVTRNNHYASRHKQNADVISTVFTLSGYRAVVRKYTNSQGSISWQVDITNRDYSLTTNAVVENLPQQFVYCCTVPTSFLLVRRNGKTMVTGNCPARSPLGKRVRGGFVAKSGHVLLSVDLDQVELRVGAHLAGEEKMIQIFRDGLDIHRATAALALNIPMSEVTSEQRTFCKCINFGVFYGMSWFRLKNELALLGINVTKQWCQDFIDTWLRTYPRIGPFLEDCHQQARTTGFVRTLFGHLRWLPNIHSSIDHLRAEAERQAGNAPVQGTAGEVLKIAMKNIWDLLPTWQKYAKIEPLLNIHDEIIFEVEEEYAPLFTELVAIEMSNAVQLDCPLGAKGNYGYRWSDLK